MSDDKLVVFEVDVEFKATDADFKEEFDNFDFGCIEVLEIFDVAVMGGEDEGVI